MGFLKGTFNLKSDAGASGIVQEPGAEAVEEKRKRFCPGIAQATAINFGFQG